MFNLKTNYMIRLLQYFLVFLFLFIPNLIKAEVVYFYPFDQWGYARTVPLSGKEIKVNDQVTFSFQRNGSIIVNTPTYFSDELRPSWGIIELGVKSYMDISVPDDYIIHQVIVNYSLEKGSLKINSEPTSDGNWIGYANNVRIAAPFVETTNEEPYRVRISAIIINYIPNIKSENINLNYHNLNIYPGSQFQLSAKLTPSNTTVKQIDWESSNPEVATVDEGMVKALSKGTTVIRVKNGDVSDSCYVSVTDNKDWEIKAVSDIKVGSEDDTSTEAEKTLNGAYLLGNDIILREDQIPVIQFSPKVEVSVYPELEVNFTDESIVMVNLVDTQGSLRIMGNKKGECSYSVNIKGTNIIIATGKIKVIPKIPITSIVMEPQKIKVANGATQFKIIATIQPEDATYKDLDWSIDNTQAYRLGTEENGEMMVLVKNGGEAIIKANATDDPSTYGTCQVSMIDINDKLMDVEPVDVRILNKDHDTLYKETESGPVMYEGTLILREKQKAKFKVTIHDIDVLPILKWETSNDFAAIESVSKDGMEATIIGINSGMSNFNIFINENGRKDIFRGGILIVREEDSIVMDQHDLTIHVGQQKQLNAKLFIKEVRDTTVNWHSGNIEIVTVNDKGIVSGVRPGKTFVVSSCNELSDTCWVTVDNTFLFNAMEDFRLEETSFPIGRQNATSFPLSFISNSTGFKYNLRGCNMNMANPNYLLINDMYFEDPYLEFELPYDCESIEFYTSTIASNYLEVYANDNLIWRDKVKQKTKYEVVIPSEYQISGTKYKFATTGDSQGFYYLNYTLRQTVDVNPVLLNYNEMTLLVGETFQLQGYLPQYANQDDDFVWKSENPDIVDVSEKGLVIANKSGKANIIVTNGKFRGICTVKVHPIDTYMLQEDFSSSKCGIPYVYPTTEKEVYSQLTGINYIIKYVRLNSSSKELYLEGEMSFDLPDDLYQIKMASTYPNSNYPQISIYTDKELIGIYDLQYNTTHTITIPPQCRKKGTVYRIVSTNSYNQRFKAFGYVLLKDPVEPENLILNPEELSLTMGETYTLKATVLPNNTTDKTIIWESSRPEIVSVSEGGKLKAITEGEATITASCGEVSATCKVTVLPVKAENIILSHEFVELESGRCHQLTATVNPSHTTHKTILWSSSDPTVAEVDNSGLVMAKNIGITDIKAQCGEVSAICTITVSSPSIDPESIKLNIADTELNVGETFRLTATVLPENATNKSVIWKSTNEQVVTVSEMGLIEAISEGMAKIIASCGDVTATCNVTVVSLIINAEDIVLNNENAELNIGETLQLSAKVLPENTTNKSVIWKSTNEWVATVSETGLIEAISEGMAKIIASCGDVTAICDITVVSPIINAEQILLNIEYAELKVNETLQLEVSILPENVTDKTLEWFSSKPEVASISQTGLITALSYGNTEIVCSCGDISATCLITVIDATSLVDPLPNQESKISIYSTEGFLIKKHCKVEDLKKLDKGIYIIVSGKERYKIYL